MDDSPLSQENAFAELADNDSNQWQTTRNHEISKNEAKHTEDPLLGKKCVFSLQIDEEIKKRKIQDGEMP